MAYNERLRPPALWWVIGLLVGATFVIAVAVFLGRIALVVTAVLAVGVTAVALVWSQQALRVDDSGVTVGRARLEWPYVGKVRALDTAATHDRMRASADPSAYLAYRTYANESVEITVDDPADPHPFWLVSTRDANNLAARIEEARPA